MNDDLSSIDLAAYCDRIGFAGDLNPTVETLEELHFAHATAITFENLDILLGRPIRIDLPSIQAKLVTARRGGYCFEQNRLFAAVLGRIGFHVTYLAARVRYNAHRILPRTHALLLIEAGARRWVADVGFGRAGLLRPIALVENDEIQQGFWSYRLIVEERLWVLQSCLSGVWESLYSFSLDPQFLPDLEMANYYVSTHPDSRFVQTLIAQRSAPNIRYMLRNLELTVDCGSESRVTTLREEVLLEVLADKFRLYFPAGTRFAWPAGGTR